jgi:hypothetical protein
MLSSYPSPFFSKGRLGGVKKDVERIGFVKTFPTKNN